MRDSSDICLVISFNVFESIFDGCISSPSLRSLHISVYLYKMTFIGSALGGLLRKEHFNLVIRKFHQMNYLSVRGVRALGI